jgi:hypothetical protein
LYSSQNWKDVLSFFYKNDVRLTYGQRTNKKAK